MIIGTGNYEEYLYKSLEDKEHALGYLKAASVDEDPRVFIQALKDVLHAQSKGAKKVLKEDR